MSAADRLMDAALHPTTKMNVTVNAIDLHSVLKKLKAERTNAEKSERRAKLFGQFLHAHILAMSAAVIDAHINGPDAGMRWIVNTLSGPGHLPNIDDAVRLGGAQAWFDAKTIEESDRLTAIAKEAKS